MLPFTVRPDDGEVLVLYGLEPAEVDELREWFCYTKPIGPSIKIMAIPATGGHGFCVVAAGNEPRPVEKMCIQKPSDDKAADILMR